MKPLKIATLYFGKLSALTGISTVLNNLVLGFGCNPNVDYVLYSLDGKGTGIQENNNLAAKKSMVYYLQGWAHWFFKGFKNRSFYISKLYAWLIYDRNAIKVVASYGNHCTSSDALLFHEPFTPFYFKRQFPDRWKDTPKVIVFHNNGDVLKMFYDQFPMLYDHRSAFLHYEDMVEEILREVDCIVFLSERAKDVFLQDNSHLNQKVAIVQNGITDIKIVKRKAVTEDKIIITTVGTVCFRKGHDLIVDAITAMKEELRNRVEIQIIGEGPILGSLKDKCRKRQIDCIKFLGPRRNVNDFLTKSDIFLLASRDEGLPMAIIEAMRMGLPIIGTNVGGIPDLVKTGINGWLIEPNVAELTDLLIQLIGSDADMTKLGEKSKELFINRFSREKMIEDYIKVFNRVTGKTHQ